MFFLGIYKPHNIPRDGEGTRERERHIELKHINTLYVYVPRASNYITQKTHSSQSVLHFGPLKLRPAQHAGEGRFAHWGGQSIEHGHWWLMYLVENVGCP